MKLLVKALSDKIGRDIPLPYYATSGAAALDLHACLDEPLIIQPLERVQVPTGLAVAIPEGYVGILAVRSSTGVHRGLSMPNGVGVIDSDYRGPLGVWLWNTLQQPCEIRPGDRFAQLLVIPVQQAEIELVPDLPETERGEGGFGSTGR
jgi:dUTP pyrophosphatase